MRPIALALSACLIAGGLTGCVGDDGAPTESPPVEDPAAAPSSDPQDVRTLATANGTVEHLGLAVYDGVDPDRVEPLVPGNMTPVACFQPDAPDTVDVTLIAGQRSYEGVPDGGEPVAELALVGCAERTEGLARDAANEVAWVGLLGWTDNQAYTSFLGSIGFPTASADIEFEEHPSGYTVSAEANGTWIVEARFLTSPVGIPGASFYSCEPGTQNGRSIVEAPDGSLVAFDWNKTEAICPAQAEITWPWSSPLADVLGPAHPHDVVVDTRVEEARYWWRDLPPVG